jgi:lysophospholipase L1-like esterase
MAKNLVLMILSICFTLALCELFMRYRFKAAPFQSVLFVPDYLTDRDSPLRWRFSPSDGRNSLGLRNRELGPKKTGTYRILFLGDSTIWSGRTTSGRLFTEVLEQRLNSLFSGEANCIEVINAGIPGYTTYQELEFLRIYGLDMKPDLVVLGFVFNDLYYKYLHRPSDEKLLDFEPSIRLNRFNPDAFPARIFSRSYLAHEVAGRCAVLWKRLRHRPVFPFEKQGGFYLAWKDYGWNRVRKLIGEMHALSMQGGCGMVIMVFPVRDQTDDQYRALDEPYVLYPQRKIRGICDELAIPMLDLTEPLHSTGGKALFRDDVHLKGRGNDIVLDELEKFLVSQLDLPASR